MRRNVEFEVTKQNAVYCPPEFWHEKTVPEMPNY